MINYELMQLLAFGQAFYITYLVNRHLELGYIEKRRCITEEDIIQFDKGRKEIGTLREEGGITNIVSAFLKEIAYRDNIKRIKPTLLSETLRKYHESTPSFAENPIEVLKEEFTSFPTFRAAYNSIRQ